MPSTSCPRTSPFSSLSSAIHCLQLVQLFSLSSLKMDLDALMNSMKQEMYGGHAELSDGEDPLPEQELSTETLKAAKGIWNPTVTASNEILKRAVAGRSTVQTHAHPGSEAARWKAVRALQSRFERLCAKHLGEHWNPAFER